MIPQRTGLVIAGAVVLAASAGPAAANTFTETFSGGSNVGGWLYGGPAETIEASGGNPGAYFAVPSQDTSLPPGWQTVALGPNAPAPDWNDVITDVDQVRFFYGDPTGFFIFQMWDVGMDNLTIVGDVVPVELSGFTVE